MRPTSCSIDLAAIEKNVRTLGALIAPTPMCAVVKADGYGHGAVPTAKAALAGGARWLAVALIEEGVELREAGIMHPILVMSEHPPAGMEAIVANDLTATIYSDEGLAAIGSAAAWASKDVNIHLGVDSGMGRVGVQLDGIADFVAKVDRFPNVKLAAIWTHCPVADEPDNPFTAAQLAEFGASVRRQVAGVGVHVANSAATITGQAGAAGDPLMVRCGISIYGIDPEAALAGMVELQPALTWRSAVSFVKTVQPGTAIGYGHRWTAGRETTIATVPIGYADGFRRDTGLRGGTVLIGGLHHSVVGTVAMDQMMVDVGPDAEIAVGDEVILIGTQGDEQILAADVAAMRDSIPYEVVCGIGKRVPRTYD